MFVSIFFVILTLLLVNLGTDLRPLSWMDSPSEGFLYSLAAYAILLVIFAFQKRFKINSVIAANILLTLFLILHVFVFGGDRIVSYPFPQTGPALLGLSFYLGGLGCYYYFRNDSLKEAERQVRFIVPFVVPFLAFSLLLDLLNFVPYAPLQAYLNRSSETPLSFSLFLLFSLCFMGGIMLVLPKLICLLWDCRPIQDKVLLERLESTCKRANFSHAGIFSWNIMEQYPTAAIIGIIPRYRYVLFAPTLLRRMSPDAIEAVLVHEMGHSYRKHLLFFPLILLGMIILSGFLSVWLPNLPPFLVFVFNAMLIGLYLRLVFGYFSRLFERQADLHIFTLNLPAQWMIDALDEIGVITGYTHDQPSWHHHSINERMSFLKKGVENPQLISDHHRKVRWSLSIFLLLLIVSFAILIFL